MHVRVIKVLLPLITLYSYPVFATLFSPSVTNRLEIRIVKLKNIESVVLKQPYFNNTCHILNHVEVQDWDQKSDPFTTTDEYKRQGSAPRAFLVPALCARAGMDFSKIRVI